jgi:hypothetical protein
MADVMIGIDPHKSSHTAVAIGLGEEPLGELLVRACPSQAGQLLAWAREWPERAWAIEGAAGLGNLLAQQLVAAGERVAMCRRSWLPGCGCCSPGTPARTTRMTPTRWRSRRYGPRPRVRWSPRTTPWC